MAVNLPDEQFARESYDLLAEHYASVIDTRAENALCEMPAMLSLLPDVTGKKVLDAGCGPGQYSEWLVTNGATVIAVDGSSRMVQVARRRLGGKVDVRQADLRQPLQFIPTESCQIIICPLVLDYIEEWDGVFVEFNRVLCQNGVLLFSVEHPFTVFTSSKRTNYFSVELHEFDWTEFGQKVTMHAYRRPLSLMIAPLVASGFKVDRVVEPYPVEDCRQVSPEAFARLSTHPDFLCVRAVRVSRVSLANIQSVDSVSSTRPQYPTEHSSPPVNS